MPIQQKIRVQIADDHDVVVQGLYSILKDQGDIEVVGPFISSEVELFKHLRAAHPDVLLLNVQMPNFDVLTSLGEFSTMMPRLRVIIVTALQDPKLVKAAAQRGVAGYILKEEALSSLLPLAIRDVAAGSLWFSPKASQQLIRGSGRPIELSAYQLDIMLHGPAPEVIAQTLQRSLSAQTQIREKLGVETNEQAIVLALRERLVPLNFA